MYSLKICILFIFGCAGSLLLLGLFSSYSRPGLLCSWDVQASHCFFLLQRQALGPLEEEMATHSSILARKIARTEEPGGL